MTAANKLIILSILFSPFTENLGVYLQKNKLHPEIIDIQDCLSGKVRQMNVNELAAL